MVRVFSQYISSRSIALAAFESIIITLAFLVAARLRFWREPDSHVYAVPEFSLQALMCVLVMQICLYYSDFYDFRAVKRPEEQVICLGQSIGAACVVLAFLFYLFPTLLIGRGLFLMSMSIVGGAVIVSRLAIDAAWRVAAPVQNVAIFGPGEFGLKVAEEIISRDDLNLHVSGIVISGEVANGGSFVVADRTVAVLGSAAQIESIVNQHGITRIVVAVENSGGEAMRNLIRLRVQGVRVDNVHTTMAGLTGRIWLAAVPSSWFLFSDGFDRSKFTLAAKRSFDLLFGMVGLILSAPVMGIVALAVRLDSRGPVIYRQTRVGYKGKTFELLKFRSMRVDAESAGACWAQEHDPRVTRLGRFLRKYRFDELPQFINVVRGEMSFVGPRPERPMFVDQLRKEVPFYEERHMARPGITGWAQVEYQYGSTIAHACRKLEYDLFYLMNMSILFDCAIALRTVRILISGRGSR
jgi:sugar transferase (PEP-CTERM system associated)